MNDTNGVAYHWFPQLLENMNLPTFDGVKSFYKPRVGRKTEKKEN